MSFPRPLPSPNPLTAPYWLAAQQRELKLPRCAACTKFHFYPRDACPHCGAVQLAWHNVSGQGEVYSFTVVHRAPSKGFEALVPYVVAVVAQPYPIKPVRLVVPYSPAGVADIIGRVIAEKLGQRLGQNIVVFNREGGGSVVGTELVAKSSADGYTLLLASTAVTMNAALSRQSPYDVRRDFAPIGLVFEGPGVLVVHPSLSANSVQELIAYARAHPGKLRYGSSGVGGVINLVTELFKHQAQVDLTHVRFANQGGAARASTRAAFSELIDSDLRRWQTVVKAAGLRAE